MPMRGVVVAGKFSFLFAVLFCAGVIVTVIPLDTTPLPSVASAVITAVPTETKTTFPVCGSTVAIQDRKKPILRFYW